MILFIIICVIVLSTLTYYRPRPMYGWGWFDRPFFFRRHHRPMGGPRPFGRGPTMGPRPGGFGGPRPGGFGGHGPMGGHGPGHGGPRH